MGNTLRHGGPGRDDAKRTGGLLVFLGITFTLAMSGLAADPRAAAAKDELRSLSINGYFDPERNFLKATAKLNFALPASERRLWLAAELDLDSVRGGTQPALTFSRDRGQFLVLSPGEKDFELSYSGRLQTGRDFFETTGEQESRSTRPPVDDYRFLSYIKDFYPNPGIDFTQLNVNFSLPLDWNCLGSGRLCSVQPEQAIHTYTFDSSAAKGMALVCGRFSQIEFIAGTIALRLHGGPGFKYRDYYSAADMAAMAAFYSERFGALHLPELNILFKRGSSFGGVSYNGLIVLNVDENWAKRTAKTRCEQRRRSPLSMIDPLLDLLAHEMAHQWWGGLISWKAPADNWITEGLATYSTLMLLRARRGEAAFRKVLKSMGHWAAKFGRKGSCADGYKLKLLNRDLAVYQTLVYVKPALMLVELADAIGEGELCRRLGEILKERRHCNVDTNEFLRLLSAGDEGLRSRLGEWVHGLGQPKSR